jgi:hypothetical protein
MIGAKPAYHFEEAASPEELEASTASLTRKGWKPAGAPRQFELNFASGRHEVRFSQAFVRPALFPICERVRAALPPRFEVLAAPKRCDHLVHFYDDETLLLDSLESFILEGLMAGEAVVVIALPAHRQALEFRLAGHGIDLAELAASQQLLLVDAQATLTSLLRDGMPSEILFEEILGGLLVRLRIRYRAVRAFGEMVGLLWQDGNRTATHRFEKLWHAYCQRQGLVLYCAYPHGAFATEPGARRHICESHSQVIEA